MKVCDKHARKDKWMQNVVQNPLKWQRQLGRPRCECINKIEICRQNRMGRCEYYVMTIFLVGGGSSW